MYEKLIVHKNQLHKVLFSDEDKEFVETLPSMSVTFQKNTGYLQVRINQPRTKEHYVSEVVARILMDRICNGCLQDKLQVDHIDRNPLNNQRENLRLSTKDQNMANRGVQKNNTSGFHWISIAYERDLTFFQFMRPGGSEKKRFYDLHEAITYVYPIFQQIKGEFSPEKRSLEEVLKSIENVKYPEPIIKSTICQYCDKELSTVNKNTNHEKICKENPDRVVEKYNCDECDKSYTLKDNLRRHKRESHPIPSLIANSP